ncbi:riboflavin synthase [Listeria valentina]|uniref:riboflavin synthase n=1 Tax=Listeria valentina TaxID=2705293 RepID=UPI001431E454|nr:riboflavin synthase [Listeria valentina]
MFTGLIQGKGKVSKLMRERSTIKLSCSASEELLDGYEVGDSMAINGVCLTAVSKSKQSFTVDIMPETFNRTTFARLKVGDEVNLERALLFHGRLEGHLVAGHVDQTIRLVKQIQHQNALVLTFNYPAELQGEIIPQGSVALNGVSLTVTEVSGRTFSVSLIPHSKHETNLGSLRRGELVNIETDMVGKYLKAQSPVSSKERKEAFYL